MGGEKLHWAVLGRPEQESATGELKAPPREARVTVRRAADPCLTVTEMGATATEKSAPTPLSATSRLVVLIPSEPPTARVPAREPIAEGVKVTLEAHEAPPGNPGAEQVFVCEKSPLMAVLENWKQVVPVLLKVTDCELLEVPIGWLGNASALLEKLTLAERTNS